MSAVLSPSSAPSRSARRARAAVAALFLTNGALFANVVPRYPQIKAELGVSNAVLGTALAAMPLGALLAGLFAAAIIRRFRSGPVAAVGIVVLAVSTLALPFAPTWVVFAVLIGLVGALDAIVDVAQNSHGLRVQRVYGRSIVNSFHGLWSIGAVTGGLMGSAAAGLRLPLALHLTISALLFSAVALAALRYLLPGPDTAERPSTEPTPDAAPSAEGASSGHPASDTVGGGPAAGAASVAGGSGRRRVAGHAVRMIAALGLLAACGALVEDAGASWGALYLTGLGAGAATAGLAFVALQTAMTIGRLTGDRVVDRFGQRTVARAGGALAALGMGLALALPSVPTTLAGFALAGLGFATLVPAAMLTADELPGLAPGTGLTVVSWLLRGGFLLSPPLVGLLADATSLRVGLLTVVAAGLITVIGARVLLNRTP
ncbi:MFS transporter [Cryptosporangium sp. NPDC048952]|uniref:MFS transporter n=1 Tax=Cryptosporangium sp. NPDC048952 TaxID=3363961 RepID=UPI003718C791